MRSLVPLLALALAACTVTVSFVPPTIQNLWTQDRYCTYKTTRVDFSFDFSGVLTRLDVYLLDDGQTPDQARPGQKVASLATLILGQGRATGYVDVTPRQTQQALSPQGIIVEPVRNKRLWVQGFNVNAPSEFVRSSVVMVPDRTGACDPLNTAP
uniref:Lipoprotein n=1 Tax=Thermus islandicus TaxID=540988 RepID=A0A831U7K7_9DEIN